MSTDKNGKETSQETRKTQQDALEKVNRVKGLLSVDSDKFEFCDEITRSYDGKAGGVG